MSHGSKIGKNKKIAQGWEIGAKDDILTVQERKISHIGNKTKRSLEMTPWKIEVEAQQLKATKMHMKELIEKGK